MADNLYSNVQAESPEPPVYRKPFELLISVFITGVLVFAGYYLFDPATLPIRQVRIEGEFRNLSTAVLQERMSKEVKGGFFNIDVAAVRDALLEEPWVRDISVQRVWPDSLQVFVTEQIAAARWRDTGLLNRSGRLFVPDKATFPDGLPVLSGPEGTQAMMMEKYSYLHKQLESLLIQITTLNLDERRAWSFETDTGLKVVLGRSDFDERVNRFVELMPVSLGKDMSEAELIDMRYPNGFAVRWKHAGAEVTE